MLSALPLMQLNGYSTHLAEAIRAARHPDVSTRPDTRVLLQLLDRLHLCAAPPFEHLPAWLLMESAEDTPSAHDGSGYAVSRGATGMEGQTANDGLDQRTTASKFGAQRRTDKLIAKQ
jgi:hypothetical protein